MCCGRQETQPQFGREHVLLASTEMAPCVTRMFLKWVGCPVVGVKSWAAHNARVTAVEATATTSTLKQLPAQ